MISSFRLETGVNYDFVEEFAETWSSLNSIKIVWCMFFVEFDDFAVIHSWASVISFLSRQSRKITPPQENENCVIQLSCWSGENDEIDFSA